MSRICSVMLLMFLIRNICFSQNFQERIRLSEEINHYQPTLLPIVSPDGKTLYFDRKWHPENTGGIQDDDDVWFSEQLDSLRWTKPERAKGQINIATSNALLYIFPSGNEALVYGSYDEDSASYGISRLKDGSWSKPIPLKIKDFSTKSKNYSATISADRRVLIMSLEREDSFGGLDLYISFLNDTTGEYSSPKNLGKQLNTKGIEFVSFLAYDNRTLYFASSGRRTKGKLDLFLSRRVDESWLKWSEPIPLDSSINTSWDENSISLSVLGDTAYFISGDDSTKREGIYFAVLPSSYQPLPYIIIQGMVVSNKNGKTEPLAQPVEFVINNFDGDFSFRDTVFDGHFRFAIPYNTQYNFFVNSDGFESFSFSTNAWYIKETFLRRYNVYLKPEVTSELKEKSKLTETLIGTIYFATDVDTLDADAQRVLTDLKDFLINNQDLKIRVVGHTDEVGTEAYNIDLSLRRAKNTAKFLSEILGVAYKRIQIEGKGKAQPVSQDFSKNRRVEILVIGNE